MATRDQLSPVRFSPVEPDTVNYEIWGPGGDMLADLAWDPDGNRKICFWDGFDDPTEVTWGDPALEQCSPDFRALVLELSELLDEWAAALRTPGNIWHPDKLASGV